MTTKETRVMEFDFDIPIKFQVEYTGDEVPTHTECMRAFWKELLELIRDQIKEEIDA